jgi:hypothetical protein
LKKQLIDIKEQEALQHPPSESLHVEIIDLKSKQEEIKSQQMTFKQETETHINSWAQVVRGREKAPPPPPPLAVVEEVVQAKLMDERTRQARELNLKVRRLPLPLPSAHPVVIRTLFLKDTLDLQDVTLNRAWIGFDSTLFL